MTTRDAHPDANEYGTYHSSDDSDGPHKQIRQQGVEILKETCANMVKNHNRQSRMRSFQVGDYLGVKVDRPDRGHCDRVPCLIIGLNRRQHFQLRCEVSLTKRTARLAMIANSAKPTDAHQHAVNCHGKCLNDSRCGIICMVLEL